MTKPDNVARLREWASTICTVRNDEVPGSKAKLLTQAADEIERLREERDQARRAWCLYLAANTGLPKERIADMNGYGDCFDRIPNDIEAHEVRGDVARGDA